MGGKSSGNDELISQQKKEAAEARKKEEQRKIRIQQGMANIKAAFEGKPATTSTTTSTKLSGTLPTGYSYKTVGGTPDKKIAAKPGYTGGSGDRTKSGGTAAKFIKGTPGVKKVLGPDGKYYAVGSTQDVVTETPTGAIEGGFGKEFYDKYGGGIVDYYMPQVTDQYGDARDELTYRLARAGTGRSSAGNVALADLVKQNEVNTGDVYAKADTAAGDLRSRVNKERANAESQVQTVEDPNAVVNQALAAVHDLSLEKPDTSPLGEMFKIALVGGANAATGYQNARSSAGYDAMGRRYNTPGSTIVRA
jgi:hypothetical protein